MATQLLETGTNPVKVMVLFTDGNTTAGPPPAPIAAQARRHGFEDCGAAQPRL